jgi:hypothetical protein
MLLTCAGKWALKDTELTQSSVEGIPVGNKERKTVIELTTNRCRLRTKNGTEERYGLWRNSPSRNRQPLARHASPREGALADNCVGGPKRDQG